MWYDKRLYRLLVIVATYVLGALGASILRNREEISRFPGHIPVMQELYGIFGAWAIALLFLPLGVLYYLDGWGGWILAGFALVGLVLLAIGIMKTGSRVALILGYTAFIVLVAVLARGCGLIRVEAP
jgi:hypothetical protein